MPNEGYERARADVMRALREKYGNELADEIMAVIVAGVRREVAEAIAQTLQGCTKSAGCALPGGHPGFCKTS